MKLLKWLLLGILLLVVVAAGSVAWLVATLDPNDYKPQIAAQVKKATGRDLTIAGDIEWSLFPWLGLDLGRTTLANPPGFSTPVFAGIEQAQIHVALTPLLKKRIETKKILLEGVTVNLEKLANGKDNWSDLGGKGEAQPAGQQEAGEGGGVPDVDIRIAGLEVANAKLSYTDRQSGTSVRIDPFNLRTGVLALNRPVPVEADLTAQLDGMTARLQLNGKLTADLEHGRYRFDDLGLTKTVSGESIPGGSITATSRLDLKADLKGQTLDIDPLTVEALDLTLDGNVHVRKLLDAPTYSGELRSNAFSPKALLTKLDIAPPPTSDPAVLGNSTLGFRFNGDTRRFALTDLEATLDDSTLQGEVSVADFSRMALRFKLLLDQIDVDRYLPPVGKASAADVQAGKAEAGASDVIALPIDMLRSLDLQGAATVKKLTASKLLFEDASVTLSAQGGKLAIAPLSADLYQGHARIDAALDVTGKTPKYSSKVDLAGVRSEGILETLFGDRYISGTANFNASVRTAGNTVSGLIRQLGGKFAAKFTDGTIKGSKLSRKIHEAQNVVRKFQGKPPLTEEITEDTKFSLMQISGVIRQGVISSDDLKIVAPIFRAHGSGKVDLPAMKIDYTLRLATADAPEKDYNYLPIRITGPFSDLSIKLKADAMAKARAKVELDKKKAELKKKLDEEKAKKEAELRARAEEEKARLKAKADAEKARAQEKLKAKEDELKQKLEEQLQDKLKGLFK